MVVTVVVMVVVVCVCVCILYGVVPSIEEGRKQHDIL